MKKMAFAIIVVCFGLCASAQKVFFIYLQAENRAPFYVRLGEKVLSSSTSGYLILSNLRDSVYTIAVGSPGAKNSEARFNIPVEGSDKGFLLKTFDDGPALFDLQTLVIHKPNAAVLQSEQMISRTDSFTRRLAQAADDQSLLTVPVVAKKEDTKVKETRKEPLIEIVKVEPIQESKKEEAAAADTAAAIKTEEKPLQISSPSIQKEPEVTQVDSIVLKKQPVKEDMDPDQAETQTPLEEPFKRSVITRRSESSTTEGFGLIYLDVQQEGTDTIRLLIPNPKKTVVIEDKTPLVEPVQPTISNVQAKEPANTPRVPTETRGNSCPNIATEKDFLKLRKNMAAETNDEEMISEARKYFKTRCFSTEQVRYLSTLFLTNAAKYQFFDAAFKYVTDPNLFPTLSAEIKDDYYSKRFKALIGE